MKVKEVKSNSYRSFLTFRSRQTWDGTGRMCCYVPSMQRFPMFKSVIEGNYTHYQIDSLFATDFLYTQFDDEKC